MHPIVPLLQLIYTVKRIEGRKKLQKTVHILKELDVPFTEPFEYSHYGMYSLRLKNEIGVLCEEGLVREVTDTSGGAGTFVVEETDALRELVREFGISEQPSWSDLAHRLNRMPATKLEGISTVLFLRHTDSKASFLSSRLVALKPHLAELAEECVREADELVRSSAATQVNGPGA